MVQRILFYQEHRFNANNFDDLFAYTNLSALPEKEKNQVRVIQEIVRSQGIEVDIDVSLGIDSWGRVISVDTDESVFSRKGYTHELAGSQLQKGVFSDFRSIVTNPSVLYPFFLLNVGFELLLRREILGKYSEAALCALIGASFLHVTTLGYVDKISKAWFKQEEKCFAEGMQAESLKNVKFIKVPSLPELQRYWCVRIIPSTINKIILLVCDFFAWIHNNLFASPQPRKLTQQL